MKCKIFKGDIPTVERDINLFLENFLDQSLFKIVNITQSYSQSSGQLIITIIYSL